MGYSGYEAFKVESDLLNIKSDETRDSFVMCKGVLETNQLARIDYLRTGCLVLEFTLIITCFSHFLMWLVRLKATPGAQRVRGRGREGGKK